MPSLEQAHAIVTVLVKDFADHESKYLAPSYQEAEVRKDFIDKFLIALGWDVNHDTQKNPYEQEVKVERGQQQGTARKRADYAFSLAPNYRDVRFFAEAKKPSVDIANAQDYFQTLRYGWNSGNPLVIITDFEQFHILDSRYKPNVETALNRLIKDGAFHYSDYLDSEKFSRIYWLFSREAVASGSLEKFAAALPKPRGGAKQLGLFKDGTQKIDESFLEELDEYRLVLARAFKKTDNSLDGDTLTELVQRTLDRLVFIRFLEDRLIEPDYLVSKFGQKDTAWRDFIATCHRLDGIYNGIVFKKHASLDAAAFEPDGTAFADICERLSHLNSPYDFNAIPIHILGSIYERFLGKVIVATAKQARVEEKPEVRKAGGVYYTPEYIVRYIVANTVGSLVQGKNPDTISKLKFADVSCGSGSFLLGIFEYLLEYFTSYYNTFPKQAVKGDCLADENGYLRLTLKKRREILLNNVYGVDIDTQAVEVAQLSLYLRLLQDETVTSARQHQLEFHETLLPTLASNIKCGNSLIGTDILEGQLFDPVEERKLNPMDFNAVFPQLMSHGGFDAVVGNPPYGADFNKETKEYLLWKFKHQSYQLDSYLIFLELALDRLVRGGGYVGMIIPNPWLTNLKQGNLRRFIVSTAGIHEIVHFEFPVFPKVTVDTEIVVLQKNPSSSWKVKATIVESLKAFQAIEESAKTTLLHQQQDWIDLDGQVFNIYLSAADKKLVAKCSAAGSPLEQLCDINVGIKPYQKGKGKPPQTEETVSRRPFDSESPLSPEHRQYLMGKDIGRYLIQPIAKRYLKYGEWLAEPRPAANFNAKNKILIRQTGDSIVACIDSTQMLCLNNMHVLVPIKTFPDINYLLGIINSRLLNWYFHTLNPEVGEALAEVKKANVAKLPINIDVSLSGGAKSPYERLIYLVKQMIISKEQVSVARSDKNRDYLAGKCSAIDIQIDSLVYEMYGLSKDEIQLVEAST